MRKLLIAGLLLVAVLGFYVAWPALTGWQIKSALDRRDGESLGRKIDFASVRTSLRPVVVGEVEKRIDQVLADLGPAAGSIGPRLKQELAPKISDSVITSLVTPDTMIRIAAEGSSVKQVVERSMREQLGKMGGIAGGLGGLGIGGGTGQGSGQGGQGGLRIPGGLGGLIAGGAGAVAQGGGGDLGRVLGGLAGGQKKDAAPAAAAPAATPATVRADKPTYGLANIKRFRPTGLAGFELGIARDPAASEPDLTVGMAFTGGDWKVVSVQPKL